MRRAGPALLILLVLASATGAGEGEPIRAGEVSARYLRNGLGYAVYAPKTWRRRKPVPVVVHVVMPGRVPPERLRQSALLTEADRAARDGFLALHIAVLPEAPNKENTRSSPKIDRERYVRLLERDAGMVDVVIEAVAAEVPIRRDALFIRGWHFSGEAALGIALRRPDTFAGAMTIDMQCSTINWVENAFALPWPILPEGAAREESLGLPIFMTHLKGMRDTEEKARKVNLLQVLLREEGFRRVEVVTRTTDSEAGYFMTPECWAWLKKIRAEREVAAAKRIRRDALLADGVRQAEKGRLSSALRLYAQARELETMHSLAPATQTLYARLVEMGRAGLEEADALPPVKRKAGYRKVAKLFAGTPFGEEVADAVRGMP